MFGIVHIFSALTPRSFSLILGFVFASGLESWSARGPGRWNDRLEDKWDRRYDAKEGRGDTRAKRCGKCELVEGVIGGRGRLEFRHVFSTMLRITCMLWGPETLNAYDGRTKTGWLYTVRVHRLRLERGTYQTLAANSLAAPILVASVHAG